MHDSKPDNFQQPNIIVAINKANNHQKKTKKLLPSPFMHIDCTLSELPPKYIYRGKCMYKYIAPNKNGEPFTLKKPRSIFNALVHDVLWILLIGIYVCTRINCEECFDFLLFERNSLSALFFHPVYNFVDEKLSAITFKFRGRMMYDARLYDVLR